MRSRESSYIEAVDKLGLLLDDFSDRSLGEEGATSLCEGRLSLDNSIIEGQEQRDPSQRKKLLQRTYGSSRALRRRSRRLKPSSSRRHNSWHNLIKVQSEEEVRSLSRSDDRYEDILLLAKNQEKYIRQLEEEGRFSREKLNKILGITKDLLEERPEEQQSLVVESLHDARPWNGGNITPFKLENIGLKKEIASLKDAERLKEQALRREIQVLSDSLNQLRSEYEEVSRRESEAVEQVKRSVEVAEQVRLEKTDLEFENGQLKIQVERQQNRIRTLIEEQVIKSEEERNLAEKKYEAQLLALKEEFTASAGTSSRIHSENEKLKGVLVELRRNLEDRDKLIHDLRADNDKRISDLQLEVVSSETKRQSAHQEVALLNLDLDGLRHELKSEKTRSKTELHSAKLRLERTEEMLSVSREENLQGVERSAALERELRLLRLNQESGSVSSNNALLESYVKENDSERRSHRLIVDKLEDLVRRQGRIIGELKGQVADLADKLEAISKDKHSVDTEAEDLRSRLVFLVKSKSDLEAQYHALEAQGNALRAEISRQDAEIREFNVERRKFLNEILLKEEEKSIRKNEKRIRQSPALNSAAIIIHRKDQRSSPKKVPNTF